MKEVLQRAGKEVQDRFRAMDPDFQIEMRDKTKDPARMIVQHLVVSHPKVIGQVMVKLEFWRVSPQYLSDYQVELRQARLPGVADYFAGISPMVPSATKASAFADKLVAFATRPHLKWRDLYDLWWLGTQSHPPINLEDVAGQYLHHLQAYNTYAGLHPWDAMLHLMRRYSDDDLVSAADPDLKNWLPASVWDQLEGDGVRRIVQYVRRTLEEFSARVEAMCQDEHCAECEVGVRPACRQGGSS